MNYSKLYDPEKANQYVWPMTPKAYKPDQSTSNQFTKNQTGMYDEEGFFCTYQPPVEGIRPGKYIRVLYGEQINEAKSNYERDKTYAKYGTTFEAVI